MCAAIATVAGALLAVQAGVALAVTGALLLGGSLAAVIPSLLAVAMDAQPEASARISGILMFASGGGSLLAPAVIGGLADRTSLGVAIWLIPAFALCLWVLHLSVRVGCQSRNRVLTRGDAGVG